MRPLGRLPSLPRLTFAELWAALAVLLPVLGAVIAPLSTVDLAYNVRAGDLMLASRDVLRADPFTFTAAGQPWLDQQWGAQVLLALGYGAAGWAGLAVLRAVLVGLTFWLVLRACRLTGPGVGLRTAAWLTLGGFVVSAVALGLRPQLFGMVLFALTLALLADRERHPARVWLLPVLVAAWANLHGSFVLGPLAIGATWLEDAVGLRSGAGRLLAVGVASVLAACVSPFGPAVWAYAAGITANPEIRRLITEWQPTSPLSFAGGVFYVSAVLVGLLGLLARRRRVAVPWPALAWLAGLFVVAAYAERGVAWWALGAPVVAVRLIGPGPARLARPEAAVRPSRANGGLALVLAVAVIALLPVWRGGDPTYGPPGLLTDAPRGVTEAARSVVRPNDRIFNPQPWGSWLEFAVPGAPVFVDSRVELFPASVWDDYDRVSTAAGGWQAVLDRWGVTLVVASRHDQAPLIAALAGSPSWRPVASNADGAVYARR